MYILIVYGLHKLYICRDLLVADPIFDYDYDYDFNPIHCPEDMEILDMLYADDQHPHQLESDSASLNPSPQPPVSSPSPHPVDESEHSDSESEIGIPAPYLPYCQSYGFEGDEWYSPTSPFSPAYIIPEDSESEDSDSDSDHDEWPVPPDGAFEFTDSESEPGDYQPINLDREDIENFLMISSDSESEHEVPFYERDNMSDYDNESDHEDPQEEDHQYFDNNNDEYDNNISDNDFESNSDSDSDNDWLHLFADDSGYDSPE